MADTKISGASAVTTLGGTEEFPLALSGASKKITSANLKTQVLGTAGSIPIASLADPTTGKVIGSSGSAAAAVFPPGYVMDYVEKTTPTTVSATTEGTPTDVVVGNSVTFAAIPYRFEFFAPRVDVAASDVVRFALYDSTTSIGIWSVYTASSGTVTWQTHVSLVRYITPTAAAHTYKVAAWRSSSNGTVQAGVGGAAAFMPAFLRITVA